ncbi:MAG: hypothetical protein KBT07_00220 [Clostridiales bacterium]|nr:hypothetical protein [Candidatus Scatonaster coprocaballi]
MRRFKKLLAVCLSVLLIMSMAVTVFAADPDPVIAKLIDAAGNDAVDKFYINGSQVDLSTPYSFTYGVTYDYEISLKTGYEFGAMMDGPVHVYALDDAGNEASFLGTAYRANANPSNTVITGQFVISDSTASQYSKYALKFTTKAGKKIIHEASAYTDDHIAGVTITMNGTTQTPSPDVWIDEGNHYHLLNTAPYTSYFWDPTYNQPLNNNSYRDGDTALVKLYLEPDDGYEFDTNYVNVRTGGMSYRIDIISSQLLEVTLYVPVSENELIKTVSFTNEAPLCGTTVTADKYASGNYNWDTQTNPPKVSIPSDVHFHLDDNGGLFLPAYWIKDADASDGFLGTFEGGNKAYAYYYFETEDGYDFSLKMKPSDITVPAGKVIDIDVSTSGGLSYLEVFVEMDVEHVPSSEWEHDADGHWHLCEKCGKPACACEAHDPSDWIVDAQPQLGKDGSAHQECLVCSRVLGTKKLPALTPTPTPEPGATPTPTPGATPTPTPGATPTPTPTPAPGGGTPKTGESASLLPIMAILLIAASAASVMCVVRRKHDET